MQTDFTSWYEPLVDAAAEPQASATLEGRMSSAPGGDGGSGNSGCLPAPHSSVRNQTISASTEGVGGVKGGGGRGGNGFETPSRRPRPPVNAWGTPPASENRRPPNRGRGAGGAVNGGEAGGSVPTLTGERRLLYVKLHKVGVPPPHAVISERVPDLSQISSSTITSASSIEPYESTVDLTCNTRHTGHATCLDQHVLYVSLVNCVDTLSRCPSDNILRKMYRHIDACP